MNWEGGGGECYTISDVCVRCCIGRLKAGLKLHEEAEKKEVEQGIHLLEDPEGMCG